MTEILARVTHETVKPRTSEERTVEVVTIEGRDTIELKFYRVGECVDTWQFVEAHVDGERYINPEVFITKIVAQAVLKRTPCVSIRDESNQTLAAIDYADPIGSQSSFYDIQGEPDGHR